MINLSDGEILELVEHHSRLFEREGGIGGGQEAAMHAKARDAFLTMSDLIRRVRESERTLQRVRDVLTNADSLYGTAHGAHVRVLAILNEESGR